MIFKKNKKVNNTDITNIANSKFTDAEKVILLQKALEDKDKLIEKYRKLIGEIEITDEEKLLFELEQYRSEQVKLLDELRGYKKEYAELVAEQKMLNEKVRELM